MFTSVLMLDNCPKKAFNLLTMSEQRQEDDYRDSPRDMTPEANVDISYARLLRHELLAGHVLYIDGRMVVDAGGSESKNPSEEELRTLQARISQEEAGDQMRPTDHLPEAS